MLRRNSISKRSKTYRKGFNHQLSRLSVRFETHKKQLCLFKPTPLKKASHALQPKSFINRNDQLFISTQLKA